MANAVRQRIELDITKHGRRAILTIKTDKGYRGGVRSGATVAWSDGQFESHLLYGDFDTCQKTTQGRATQKAIDTQHAAVFTPDVVAALVVEAKAFYAQQEVTA